MTSQPAPKLSLFALTAMVIGSLVGLGIFSLPRTFGLAMGPFGAIFAWCMAGGGIYMLACMFQALAEPKPDLDAGVYAYANTPRSRPGSATIPAFCQCSSLSCRTAPATYLQFKRKSQIQEKEEAVPGAIERYASSPEGHDNLRAAS
jgi:hypothetical protein